MTRTDSDLQKRVEQHASDSDLPGLVVAIIRDGHLDEIAAVGQADRDAGTPMTGDTIVRIASVTKTMTALLVAQLVSDGKLAFDDPVNDHLTSIEVGTFPGAAPITVRHLLTHTSGLGPIARKSDMFKPGQGLKGKPGTTIPPLRDVIGSPVRPMVAPADRMVYSNVGFAVLGQLVEDVSGNRLGNQAVTRLFDPLGMTVTSFDRDARRRGPHGVGYTVRKGEVRPAKDMEIYMPSAGSVWSSITDMARYVEALVDRARIAKVLPPEVFEEMITTQHATLPSLGGVGLCFITDDFGGHRIAWHNGGMPGWASAMWVAPDDGLGVVAVANTFGANVGLDPFAANLLKDELGVERIESGTVPHDRSSWAELFGTYKGTGPFLMRGTQGKIVVRERDGKLQMAFAFGPIRKQAELQRTSPDDPLAYEAVLPTGAAAPVVFARDGSGAVTRMHMGPGGATTLIRQ